ASGARGRPARGSSGAWSATWRARAGSSSGGWRAWKRRRGAESSRFRAARGRRPGVTASGLRVVRVEGDATARGRRAGEALGDLVARSLAFYREYLGDRIGDVEPFRRAAERALPDYVEWLDAFAAGADASPAELFAVNALEELEQLAPVERCSTFAARGEDGTLLAHNEMWLESDRGNVAVLLEP